jgi:transposase
LHESKNPAGTSTCNSSKTTRSAAKSVSASSQPLVALISTTTIYFEGEGGETLGQFGRSKDHRSDRKQMVVGAILDDTGRPICCEMWPGNTADVKSLLPVVERLRSRFGIKRFCIVADRGMIT